MRLLLASAIAACVCCSDDGETFDYPLDDTLRLHHVRVRGTHNSYHVAPDPVVSPDLNYGHTPLDEQLSYEGVRQIELDLNYDFARDRFEVFHIFALDEGTTCRLFTECLDVVERWSRRNPAHAPIAIMLEPKDPYDESYSDLLIEALDSEITSVFGRDRIITPDFVRGDADTVQDALSTTGWPTLGEVRGQVLFWLDNHAEWSSAYSHGDSHLEDRVAFVDSPLEAPYAAIRVLNDPVALAADIAAAVSANQLVRTRIDRVGDDGIELDPALADAALMSGAHFISSDVPEFSIAGGAPYACNPDTAPPSCESTAIEDPAFIDR